MVSSGTKAGLPEDSLISTVGKIFLFVLWHALWKWNQNGSVRMTMRFLFAGMPDIWIRELDADSSARECDQDGATKGKDYEEELAKWES